MYSTRTCPLAFVFSLLVKSVKNKAKGWIYTLLREKREIRKYFYKIRFFTCKKS
jgi:hypothetical protein